MHTYAKRAWFFAVVSAGAIASSASCGGRLGVDAPDEHPEAPDSGVRVPPDTGTLYPPYDSGEPWRDDTSIAPPWDDTGTFPPYDSGAWPPYDSGTWPPYDSGTWPPYETGYDTGYAPWDTYYDSGTPVVWPPDGGVDAYPAPDSTGLSKFDRLKTDLVGTWRGPRTDPWEPAEIVEVRFEASGHFSSHCVTTAGWRPCTVFYYASDVDSPDKHYEVYDLHADGRGIGRIWFTAGSAWDPLDFIDIDGSGEHLKFEYSNRGYGPLVFDLTRVGP